MHEAHTSLTLSCQKANARTHFPRRKNSLAVVSRLVNPFFRVAFSREFRLPFGAGNEYKTRIPRCKSPATPTRTDYSVGNPAKQTV